MSLIFDKLDDCTKCEAWCATKTIRDCLKFICLKVSSIILPQDSLKFSVIGIYPDLSIHLLYVGCEYIIELTKPDKYIK